MKSISMFGAQASYPHGNFADSSCLKLFYQKGFGSENIGIKQAVALFAYARFLSFAERALAHLHCHLTDV